ncbi:DNA-binding protein H-NS [Paraburkholderia sp. BL8N3]|nr:H-NS histone family protein [Paraburkholderia sp. BL8N3]TCK31902.1 DNA-binding protein H-NS [Paraburkholderia sp. BL8N3]
MATLEEMQAQLATLQGQIDEEKARTRAEALERIKAIMAEHELTIAGLTAPTKKRGSKAGKTSVPMYQDPKSGATWSGRGRAPAWIAGKEREKFLIAK